MSIRPRNFGLLSAISLLLAGTANVAEKVNNQPHGHRSSQGSYKRNTGPKAKRAEKERRRITRRNNW